MAIDEEKLLKNFAKALGNENLLEKLEQKKKKEEQLLENMNRVFSGLSFKEKMQVEKAFEQPVPIIEDVPVGFTAPPPKPGEPAAIPLGAQPLPQLPHKDFVTRSVDALSQKSRDEYVAAVDQIPNSIRKELDILKKTVTDLHRFASRVSQMGGGGEVNLRYLDDVDRSTIADGLYLSYNATTKKFQFTNPDHNEENLDLLHITTDIRPNTDLTYSLGNTTNRWATVWANEVKVGANSITFFDVVDGGNQTLSLANQVFYITQGPGTNTVYNANAGFNAGGIILQNYTMQLANTSKDLVIGSSSNNTSVIINQNLLVNTQITFSDTSTQNVAFTDTDITLYESIKLHTDKQNTDNEYLSITVVDGHSKINFTGGSITFNDGLYVTGIRSATNQINFYSSVMYNNGELTYGNMNYAVLDGFPQAPSYANDTVATSNAITQHGSLDAGLLYYDTSVKNLKVLDSAANTWIPLENKPSVRIANVISNTVLIDFSTDNFVHIHTNQGTVTANLHNLTAGKVVELFIFNNVGGTQQFNHGVASTQATGGQSFYLSTHNTMYIKYFCLDGTANNTFVTAIS
jgi:hypothetical protein